MNPVLSAANAARYARHLALPEIGARGQARLAAGRVLIVGLGGLGSPAAFYLAAAGVGTLGLMDGDRLEVSNLQRQILYGEADLGRPKAEAAAEALLGLNPGIEVRPLVARLTGGDGPDAVAGYDVVIDACDNRESKLLIARLCHAADLPWVHAGIDRWRGQAMTVLPGRSACCACVFGELELPPPGPPAGPLGAVPGVIGSVQAVEAVKLLLGAGDLLTNRLFVYDAWRQTARCVPVSRRPDCPVCSDLGKGNG
jgi:molybdopterin/thiamine biosynthesis adenylyltransferase